MKLRWPNPPEGWSKLGWDVGIVVAGVLIALGAQEVADELRWNSAVRQERISLDEGVLEAWYAVSARIVVQTCITNRLEEIARVLDRHDRGEPLGIMGPIGRSTIWFSTQSALAMASSDGTLGHIPVQDRSAYFRVKGQTDEFQREEMEERSAWRVLDRLNRADSLDAGGWQDMAAAYQYALDSDRVMRTNLVADYKDGWLSSFKSFPPMPDNKTELGNPLAQALCKPAVTP